MANGFIIRKLPEGFQDVTDRINCCRQFADGQRWIVGSNSGVFMSVHQCESRTHEFKKVLYCKLVTQLEVLEQHDVIVVLAHRMGYMLPLQTMDTKDPLTVYHGRSIRRIMVNSCFRLTGVVVRVKMRKIKVHFPVMLVRLLSSLTVLLFLVSGHLECYDLADGGA